MTHDELRALARKLVADKRREQASAVGAVQVAPVVANCSDHVSHAVYVIVNSSDACVIEPDVECTHCNYCKSHGH